MPAGLTAIVDTSEDALFAVANNMIGLYSDPTRRAALAADLNVPLATIDAQKTSIMALASKITGRDIGPIMGELQKQFSGQLQAVTRSLVQSVIREHASTLAGSVATFSAALGTFMPALNEFVKFDRAAQAEADATRRANCERDINEHVKGPVEKLTRRQLPVPWHALDPKYMKCWEPSRFGIEQTPELDLVSAAVRAYTRFDKMRLGTETEPGTYSVRRWWMLALTLMADPRVGPVFSALGETPRLWVPNPTGGIGVVPVGSWATDEQVMLVAAPIAVSYGLDVDALAEALWNTSRGWSGAPSSMFIEERFGDCEGIVNAGIVQLAVLATDAFAIARAWKAEGRGQAGASPATPILLGALGTGALALAGASGIVLALPVALGLLVALGRRKPAVIKSRPLVPSVKL
jgi:hypothetical protein